MELRIKQGHRHIANQELMIKQVQNKISELNANKFTKLRENNPEFIELTDDDLHEYLAIYDEHMALGF